MNPEPLVRSCFLKDGVMLGLGAAAFVFIYESSFPDAEPISFARRALFGLE